MKPHSILHMNIFLGGTGLLIAALTDPPVEFIGATLVAWTLISSIETVRTLHKQKRKLGGGFVNG